MRQEGEGAFRPAPPYQRARPRTALPGRGLAPAAATIHRRQDPRDREGQPAIPLPALTVSANQMIQRALVDLRVLGVGRGVTKAHTDVAFPYLREIVDSWQMNRWAVFRVDRTRFALIAGTSEYTIGIGGRVKGCF